MNTGFDFFSPVFKYSTTVICVPETFMTERATSELFFKTCLKTMSSRLEKIWQKLLFIVCSSEYFVVLCCKFFFLLLLLRNYNPNSKYFKCRMTIYTDAQWYSINMQIQFSFPLFKIECKDLISLELYGIRYFSESQLVLSLEWWGIFAVL